MILQLSSAIFLCIFQLTGNVKYERMKNSDGKIGTVLKLFERVVLGRVPVMLKSTHYNILYALKFRVWKCFETEESVEWMGKTLA